jgi:hypothetical protein
MKTQKRELMILIHIIDDLSGLRQMTRVQTMDVVYCGKQVWLKDYRPPIQSAAKPPSAVKSPSAEKKDFSQIFAEQQQKMS